MTVEPYDQREDSEVRAAFTLAVHNKSISAIKSYWQRMIFSGRGVPPHELDSDADVMTRVAAEEGAMGYVSANIALIDGVKIIEVMHD